MAIKRTESRIPAGFTPEDLGQAIYETYDNGYIKYALVSYLTSPISKVSTINYVVFVCGVNIEQGDNYQYKWRITHLPSGHIDEDTEDSGVYSYEAEELGEINIQVEILVGGTIDATLIMSQQITDRGQGLERLIDGSGMLEHLNISSSIGSLGGNEKASRELINNFRRYVFDATDPKPPWVGIDIPARLLAGIIYAEILRVEKDELLGRDDEIDAAAAELNGYFSLYFGTQIDNALGVCQIRPQTIAMVLERPDSTNTYTPWTELPSDENEREAIRDQILNNLENLSDVDDVIVDIFNLLRFPKTNITLCARLLRKIVDRDHRWRDASRDELIIDENALSIIATEYKIGGTESPLPPKEGPPAPTDAKSNAYGKRIVDRFMKIPTVALYFMDSTSAGALAYGGYNLTRGDNDGAKRWGGVVRTAPVPLGEIPYVKALQRDLDELGFKIVGAADGKFGKLTEWTTREFQIYARMPYVAKETGATSAHYLDRLEGTINILPYSGPVSGVVNIATRIAIQYWKAHQWRCPVVIGAYDNSGNNLINNAENIWLQNDITTTAARIYARDYSQYYEFTSDPARINSDKFRIGRYSDHCWGGPVSIWYDCWAEAEIVPSNLIRTGSDYASLSQEERSTFRVIRAVSEVECLGFFDSITAYDRAIISSGPCHWTITLVDSANNATEGELCGYLSYLRYNNPDAFHKAVGNFGLSIDKNWTSKNPISGQLETNGKELFDTSLRKYIAWVRLQKDDFKFQDLQRTKEEVLYLNTWHWFYRFIMAGRTNNGYRRSMWDMARLRIRDIRNTPFKEKDNIPGIPDGNGTRTAMIGDIFTSEEAIAMLYRWHIYTPARVVCGGFAAWRIVKAVRNANIPNDAGDPTQWNDDHEESLINSLKEQIDKIGGGLQKSTEKVMAWPNYPHRYSYDFGEGVEELSSERGSFRFVDSDLPRNSL